MTLDEGMNELLIEQHDVGMQLTDDFRDVVEVGAMTVFFAPDVTETKVEVC